jgi:hypothetical protein
MGETVKDLLRQVNIPQATRLRLLTTLHGEIRGVINVLDIRQPHLSIHRGEIQETSRLGTHGGHHPIQAGNTRIRTLQVPQVIRHPCSEPSSATSHLVVTTVVEVATPVVEEETEEGNLPTIKGYSDRDPRDKDHPVLPAEALPGQVGLEDKDHQDHLVEDTPG